MEPLEIPRVFGLAAKVDISTESPVSTMSRFVDACGLK
jgi:hypothetical protein